MVRVLSALRFRENRVAASIDTPLHAFLPFAHVDHLHPDWAIAIAASANGRANSKEFNKSSAVTLFGCPGSGPVSNWRLSWKALSSENPGCDGVLLGSHGLFTWGETQRECYLNSIQTIDQMGAVHPQHVSGRCYLRRPRSRAVPRPQRCCGADSSRSARHYVFRTAASIAHYTDDADALTFAGSKWAR